MKVGQARKTSRATGGVALCLKALEISKCLLLVTHVFRTFTAFMLIHF